MEAQSVRARQRSDFLFAPQPDPLNTQTSAIPGEDCQIPTELKKALRMAKAVRIKKAVRINSVWKMLPLVAQGWLQLSPVMCVMFYMGQDEKEPP